MQVREDDSAHACSGERYDLAIIGGGALGCAVSWEGATRGLRVVLLEQDDFGSGASANSLKIVHGGLRYLQKLDIRRARMSAAERSIFLRIAPELVRPLPCVLPIRRGLARGRMVMGAGLALNAMLTLDRNRGLAPDRRLKAGGLIGRTTLAELAPGLDLEGVTGGARWFDAQMVDSERLTLAFALGAETRGASILNHHRVVELLHEGDRVTGVACEDSIGGRTLELPARVVVDCRSAWAHPEAVPPGPRPVRSIVRALNLILPDAGLQSAVGFPMRGAAGVSTSGRMLFAAPWNGVTLVGTWYTRGGDPACAVVEAAEIVAMLELANSSWGGWRFSSSDILGLHVGFMPESGESADRFAEPTPMEAPLCAPAIDWGGPAGLWYLQTEKWTTVRRLAEHLVDCLGKDENLRVGESVSRMQPLPAVEAGDVEIAVPRAIRCEHVRTLGDLVRRTAIGAAGRPSASVLRVMARRVAEDLGWDEAEQARQVDEVLAWPQFQSVTSGTCAATPGGT